MVQRWHVLAIDEHLILSKLSSFSSNAVAALIFPRVLRVCVPRWSSFHVQFLQHLGIYCEGFRTSKRGLWTRVTFAQRSKMVRPQSVQSWHLQSVLTCFSAVAGSHGTESRHMAPRTLADLDTMSTLNRVHTHTQSQRSLRKKTMKKKGLYGGSLHACQQELMGEKSAFFRMMFSTPSLGDLHLFQMHITLIE